MIEFTLMAGFDDGYGVGVRCVQICRFERGKAKVQMGQILGSRPNNIVN
jgi:hypothetical protein